MINHELALLIEKLVRNKYPEATACVIFGSQHNGSTTEMSDVDLMLFGNAVERSSHEHQYLAGWVFDIYRFNPNMFERLLRQQMASSDAYFFSAVMGGALLFDDDGVGENLREKIRPLETHLVSKAVDWRPMRLALTCLMNDLKQPNGVIEKNACCVELYQVLLRANALRANASVGPAQIIVKNLMAHGSASDVHRLNSAFSKSVGDNVDELVNLASEMLLEIGGEIRSGERIYLEGPAKKLNKDLVEDSAANGVSAHA